MVAMASAGQAEARSQESVDFPWTSTWITMAQALDHPLLLSPGHSQGAGTEAEQLT